MKTKYFKVIWTIGLVGVSAAALAGEPQARPAQEPMGFVTGAVIGAFAAGPVGAVVGAGVGTWLGNRVHRASEAKAAEAQVAALQSDKLQLQAERGGLIRETSDLGETNRALTARLSELSLTVETAQAAKNAAQGEMAASVLDGLQGDVLFRTGSAEITPEMAQGIVSLADAVAKSPALKVRVDGFADARGSVETNLKLSQARADAVRDLFLASGVDEDALEINAYGKSQSRAEDPDGYALERRVRLTLETTAPTSVAMVTDQE